MLQDRVHASELVSRHEEEFDDVIDLDKLIAAARRQWKLAGIITAGFLLLGLLYVLTAVPQYTATTKLLIDSNNSQIVNQLSAVTGVMDDEGAVLSQVEILTSKKIALAVVDKLDLLNNATFMADQSSALSKLVSGVKALLDVKSWFVSSDVTEDKDRAREDAGDTLLDNMEASRVGRTYVLSISYTSPSPQLSAQITNAIAEAYLTDQLDSKYDATRRASDWLQKRIEELRQKSLETDLAVQKFKAEKGLISTGGQLVTDQQLTQLNSQLIIAQADTADAKAKYDRIENILKSGEVDASVADSLDSTVIIGLQQKYLDASRRKADIVSRLGDDHYQAVRLKKEMQEYKRLMFEELSRIAQTYNSNYKVAQARQKSLEDQVAQATGVSASANDSQVQLRELEREADTYKKLYETFLQRYQEATQQQSFPITEARIISKAQTPQFPSKPKKSLVMALFLILGAGVGSAAGAFREFQERYFRTGEQVRQELDLEYLGQIPLEPDETYKAKPGVDGTPSSTGQRALRPIKSVSNYVIDHPLSSFAETLRSAKIAADILSDRQAAKIIGIVSALPGEGKSTVAVNFAQLLASQGNRTILIDADLRNPGASRAVAGHADKGLFEVISEGVPVQTVLMVDPNTKLTFLPTVVKRRIPYSSEILSSEAMANLIATLQEKFDYIILDLPPMGAVVDARAVAPSLDGFIMVAEWGKTARKIVRTALENNQVIANKCIGVVLNKVDSKKMGLYAEQQNDYYYNSRYGQYYRTEE